MFHFDRRGTTHDDPPHAVDVLSEQTDPDVPAPHSLIHPNPVASIAPSLMSPAASYPVHGPDRDPQTLDMAGNLGVKTDPYMVEVFLSDKISGAIGDRGVTGWPISGNMPNLTGQNGAVRVPHEYIRDVAYASDPGGRADRTRDPSASATVSANEMMQVDGVYVGSAI